MIVFGTLMSAFLLRSAQRHLGFKCPSGCSLYQTLGGKFYFPIKVVGLIQTPKWPPTNARPLSCSKKGIGGR